MSNRLLKLINGVNYVNDNIHIFHKQMRLQHNQSFIFHVIRISNKKNIKKNTSHNATREFYIIFRHLRENGKAHCIL